MGAVAGLCFALGGMVTIDAARFPSRNSLNKFFYWMHTLPPRIGSMADETWVLVNGIGSLVVGLVLLLLWLSGVLG